MALTLRSKGVSAPQSDTNKTVAREDQGPKNCTEPWAPASPENVLPGTVKNTFIRL